MSDSPRLLIQRLDLKTTRLVADPDATRALQDGQARLAIERFSLTANNITYAAFGEAMKYWQFFPAPEPDFGCLPVWGFATVAESRAEGVAVGRRVWGYYPAGSHLVVTAASVKAGGFVDGAPHRAGLAAVYNQYTFTDADLLYRPELEGLIAVLRPLFITSFLIDDFLADNAFFGARQVLLSSASSKTAFGTAFCLARRRAEPGAPRIVGLTSAGRVGFVRSLGCYDEVLPYDAVPGLDGALPSVYVDFAGDAALRRAVHERFAERLGHSASIGGTHWDALGGAGGLPGPRPTLFFAPAQVKKRSAPPPEGWGAGALMQRIGQAWGAFLARVQPPGGEPWVRIVERRGPEAIRSAYLELLDGRADARDGLMLAPQV
jgi:hypothetical protein